VKTISKDKNIVIINILTRTIDEVCFRFIIIKLKIEIVNII